MNYGKDKLLQENVQRRASKFILNYPKDMSYKDRLLNFDLLPQEYRTDLKDLVLILKAKVGNVDLVHQGFYAIVNAMHANLTAMYLVENKII